ncbi:MAG: hypothetical protein EZS28_013358 [Streblomastix strix]|uniref:Uncharacterized protein n=1 Tax=Streblomastix strix TaxID=222440 RepID=A0A5J4W8U1_9EUKA|nr:MAG: hypothetical protein EZS28_013358 [Streblomastix strix]
MNIQLKSYQRNKLLTFCKILLVLAVLSFGIKVESKKSWNPFWSKVKVNDELLVRNHKYELLDNGTYLYDHTSDENAYEYVNILDDTKFPLLQEGYDETSEAFRLITKEEFEGLNVSQHHFYEGLKCRNVISAFGRFYGLLGLSAYIHDKDDIFPSITYLLQSIPADIQIKNEQGYIPFFSRRGCRGDSDQYIVGFDFSNGIVSSECFSNEHLLPYHDDDPQGEMPYPPKPTVCDDGTQISKSMQGYKSAYVTNYSSFEMKQILTRVGPIDGYINYIDEEDILKEQTEDAIFIGWEKLDNIEQWIIVERKSLQYEDGGPVEFYLEERTIPILVEGSTRTEFSGTVFVGSCLHPTIDTPIDECPCPTGTKLEADPRKETTCQQPVDPDPEPEPQVVDCTKPLVDTSIEDCPCPTDIESQQYKDDPRTVEKGICASGSIRVFMSVFAAVVVIPMFALFC